MKTLDNRAWWLVLPAIALLVFVGVIPILTVVNYSLHDIFTLPDKYWVGFEWYSEIIRSERFHNSLLRSLTFSAVVLSIQVPLGIAIALALPRKGFMVSGRPNSNIPSEHSWFYTGLEIQRTTYMDSYCHYGHLALDEPCCDLMLFKS
jgi:ABC-type sugar transport system permease subunit